MCREYKLYLTGAPLNVQALFDMWPYLMYREGNVLGDDGRELAKYAYEFPLSVKN